MKTDLNIHEQKELEKQITEILSKTNHSWTTFLKVKEDRILAGATCENAGTFWVTFRGSNTLCKLCKLESMVQNTY